MRIVGSKDSAHQFSGQPGLAGRCPGDRRPAESTIVGGRARGARGLRQTAPAFGGELTIDGIRESPSLHDDGDIGPRRNRVTPLGDIVAIQLRGGWMGNRGILHRGTEIVSFHRSNLWITCALEHRNWLAPQWAAGHYTVLFFHDEAVACAAGHRPCALCRRPAYQAFCEASVAGTGAQAPLAKDLDRTLHAERLIGGTHRRRLHTRSWAELPDGVFALLDGSPGLILNDAVVPWTTRGYAAPLPRPSHGRTRVITPPTTLTALDAGYPIQIHSAALEFTS